MTDSQVLILGSFVMMHAMFTSTIPYVRLFAGAIGCATVLLATYVK